MAVSVAVGSGCGAQGDAESEGDAVGDPTAEALDESSTGPVEMSVADGLAPYDAESQVSQSRLIRVQQNYEDGILEGCIESLGVPRIGLQYPPSPREMIIGQSLPDFPYLAQLETDGFPLPAELRYPDRDDGHVVLTDDQQDAMAECQAEDEAAIAARENLARYQPISAAWYELIAEVDSMPEIVSLREGFAACVLDEGIAPDYSSDEGAFLGAVEDATSRLYGDPEDLARELSELGQIYYRCGVDLFEREIELRLELRDEFLDEHWEDIATISERLYGEGLIAEPATGRS